MILREKGHCDRKAKPSFTQLAMDEGSPVNRTPLYQRCTDPLEWTKTGSAAISLCHIRWRP